MLWKVCHSTKLKELSTICQIPVGFNDFLAVICWDTWLIRFTLNDEIKTSL